MASTGLLKTPVYGQSQAPAAGRVIGANDRITVGFIGVGGQGLNAHVNYAKKLLSENNSGLVAVCDVSKTRVAQAKELSAAMPLTIASYWNARISTRFRDRRRRDPVPSGVDLVPRAREP